MIDIKVKDRIKDLYIVDNLSINEISDIIGLSFNTVRHCVRSMGLRKSKEQQIEAKKRVLIEKYGTDVPLKNDDIKNKMKQTNIERYGVENPMKLESVQNKAKQTNIERYGTEYVTQNKEVMDKVRQTNMKRYGTEYVAQNNIIKNKMKQTNIERYGVENPMMSPDIKDKVAKTNEDKYGSKSPFGNKEIQNKAKITNLKRYGTEYAMQNKKVRQKVENTNMERYGSKSPFGNREIQNKIKQSNISRYGVEYVQLNGDVLNKRFTTNKSKYGSKSPFGSKDIQDKIKQYNMEKYGVEYSIQSDYVRNKIINSFISNNCPSYDILRDRDRFKQFILDIPVEDRTSTRCCEDLGVNLSTFSKWIAYHNLRGEVHLQSQRSHFEQDITDYIRTIYDGMIICNTRQFKKYELDIYIPEYNIAIEFNGSYWHNVDIVGYNYHYNKSKYFEDLGIFVYHIFEWEWLNPTTQEIIKQHIKRMLCREFKKIYARQCEIREVSSTCSKAFLNQYHLQGNINSKHRYGLYYNNELIELMTFGKTRFRKDGYELLRLCNKFNYIIVGGAERLFNHFIKEINPNKIISYCNIDKFKGDVYFRLGMRLEKRNKPNYKWVNCQTMDIKSRYQTQKYKIASESNILESESEIMTNLGYVKVEDAGTYTFVYDRR